jgi:serine/threonine protein kinase
MDWIGRIPAESSTEMSNQPTSLLHEMATGKLPFGGDTTGATFNAIVNTAPTSPVRLNPKLPDEPEHIVTKVLEKDPDLR